VTISFSVTTLTYSNKNKCTFTSTPHLQPEAGSSKTPGEFIDTPSPAPRNNEGIPLPDKSTTPLDDPPALDRINPTRREQPQPAETPLEPLQGQRRNHFDRDDGYSTMRARQYYQPTRGDQGGQEPRHNQHGWYNQPGTRAQGQQQRQQQGPEIPEPHNQGGHQNQEPHNQHQRRRERVGGDPGGDDDDYDSNGDGNGRRPRRGSDLPRRRRREPARDPSEPSDGGEAEDELALPPRPQPIGKLLSDVARGIPDSQKYAGYDGNLTYKLKLLWSVCNRYEVPLDQRVKALPIVLKDRALEHFVENNLDRANEDYAIESLRRTFEGPTYQSRMQDKWESITLKSVMKENLGKTMIECISILEASLRTTQSGLIPEFRTEAFMLNKLRRACQGHKACQVAVAQTPTSIGEFINNLQSSILSYEKIKEVEGNAFTTDHAYMNTLVDETYSQDRNFHYRAPRGGGSRGRGGYRPPFNPSNRRPQKGSGKCWICDKPGCRSFNHPKAEQDIQRENWLKNQGKNISQTLRDKPAFIHHYEVFVCEWEGYGDDEWSDDSQLQRAFTMYLDEPSSTENFEPTGFDAHLTEAPSPTRFAEPSTTRSDTHFAEAVSESFITSIAQFTKPMGLATIEKLATHSIEHQLTRKQHKFTEPELSASDAYNLEQVSRYNSTTFFGLMVDTGASTSSTAGLKQFEAYREFHNAPEMTVGTGANVRFGVGGGIESIGSCIVNSPVGMITFHIMPVDTPFLICLKDMDKLRIEYHNLSNVLVSEDRKLRVPVIRRFGHPWLVWDATLQSYLLETIDQEESWLTRGELQRLHRRFGHPSADRLHKVLERSGHDVPRESINWLTKYCKHCQLFQKSPGRFKFSLKDDVSFNSEIIVDVFWIENKPIIHVVDEATRYQAARWLENSSSKHTWDVLRMCWIDVYVGPPDLIVHDQGKDFASREFKQLANSVGTDLKAVPVEAHHSIGVVERYHTPIRRAFKIIQLECPELNQDMQLQMAVKAINDTAGPDGLVPTLLVYGTFPRMVIYDPPSASTSSRAAAIEKAMKEVLAVRAERNVAKALATRNGPDTAPLHILPLNSEVLVWREKKPNEKAHWSGPHRLLSMDRETCVIQMDYGRATFRSTSVKPYHSTDRPDDESEDGRESDGEYLPEEDMDISQPHDQAAPPQPQVVATKRKRGRPRKNAQYIPAPEIDRTDERYNLRGAYLTQAYLTQPQLSLHIDENLFEDYQRRLHDDYWGAVNMANTILQDDSINPNQFAESRQKELLGLIEKGVFKVVNMDDIPEGARVFKSGFVDEVKHIGTPQAYEKSRYVIKAWGEQEKHQVLTQSPTIQRASQRLILAVAAMRMGKKGEKMHGKKFRLWLRDITQAYVQSKTNLIRRFFFWPTIELKKLMRMTISQIVEAIKPLYGVPESGNHWFNTYIKWLMEQLKLLMSTYDPCLLGSLEPFCILGLQTDDTLFLSDDQWTALEQECLKIAGFMAKEKQELTPEHDVNFNGAIIKEVINKDGSVTITLTQERQCASLNEVTIEPQDSISSRGEIRPSLNMKDQYITQRAKGAYIASLTQPEAAFDLAVAAQTIDPTEDDVIFLNRYTALRFYGH
jgi:hypothetical protein